MPSPFPGMNPCLEHPDFWPEVHNRLIVAIADSLTPEVRPKYEVAIEKRVYELNDTNTDSLLVGVPDLAVKRQSQTSEGLQSESVPSNVAVADPETQKITVTVPIPETVRQAYLEVREITTRSVVTVIEVLSPVNKRAGEGRETYLKKRQRVLGSLTNLVEIDLLRGWQPMPILGEDIQSDYRVLVSDQEHRPRAELYPFNLRDRLPRFSIPLRSEDVEPMLNLQELFTTIDDRAGYDYRINYDNYLPELVPPLTESEQSWVQELLQQ
ncbi:DUF4058 family protein [Limnoraphis robusta]|uniref:DUF4058 family protein n=1 Tax=Limnoraphis robusta TaxID=1118279 RepID=UPI002B20F351|nr:DUF4058 family protein [Limnoraphis robusta]MEA5500667.1 DUF4058 family protein [Limnoraphis robusta BA-68 BA1]